MLLRKGIDYYTKSDSGDSAIDKLRDYDKANGSRAGRDEIMRITETLLRETDFDALNCSNQPTYNTLVLWNGLPYEALKYLLSQDSPVVPVRNCFDLIYENLLLIEDFMDDFEDDVDLLLTKYEALQGHVGNHNEYYWPYLSTLLQLLIKDWMLDDVIVLSGIERKISRCLELTADLYKVDNDGTCLDTIAMANREGVQPWLELLARNGIEIPKYLQYESDQHPEGTVDQGDLECCRLISLRFQYEDDRITSVEVDNVCKPEYIHFHPEYRCEIGKKKLRCITQLHDVFVDETGKPKQNVPGSWSQVLKPNSECSLVVRELWLGKEYVEDLRDRDLVWNEESSEWE
jgi:hypothetical protein